MSASLATHEPSAAFEQLAQQLCSAAAHLAQRGWTPTTSSNFSARLDAQRIAITISGRDKGRLTPADIMLMDDQAHALDAQRPSAEARLHAQLYRVLPHAGAVLHTHSLTQTVISLHCAGAGQIRLRGYELVKAIEGLHSHEQDLLLPVFPNSQDMTAIEHHVDAWRAQGQPLHAYLIAGHGLYVWGRDVAAAMRHLEAIDFMLACELELRKLPT
ncbi:MAG: methylthioribulose 1-phosphate dehydratase [Metallibacterium scheffleri]